MVKNETLDLKPVSFQYTDLESVLASVRLSEVLPGQLEQLNCHRVLVVASASLSGSTDDFSELQQALGSRFAGLFNKIRAHTPREDVLAALQATRDVDADLLLSIGGGSIIDACKAVQLAMDLGLQSDSELLQYAQRADGSRGPKAGDYDLSSLQGRIRQLAVPTTLSGAEFSNNAGVLDTALSAKEGYRGPGLCPQRIIYDPELSQLTPEWLWLSTAIRSLDHAVEGYCSADANPFLDGHFLHAMRLFSESLPRVKSAANDLAARSLNQQAVWLACCGLGSVAHGASHGIGYILGSLCAVPHGHTSCVMLPAVLEWNRDFLGNRQDEIARAMGKPDSSAGEAVKSLAASLGLPTSLQEVGVRKDQLQEIAERAIKHPVVRKNPRPLATADQVLEILELAWD